MQFFVDRDTVRMLLSQKEAAQLSLCSQPDCNDPKVCENLSRLLRRAAVSSGRSIPKGEFSVSVCSREQEMEITLTRLGAAQGQRQVWRFWESEQMIQGCICLHRQLCRRTREFPMESLSQPAAGCAWLRRNPLSRRGRNRQPKHWLRLRCRFLRFPG